MISLGKTLIVDDSEVYLKLASTLLRPYSSSVSTARSVREAIDAIDANPDLDVVVCDVVLGEGDGFDVLDHVASKPEPRARVLMVTGYRDEAGPERAGRMGAVGYLQKPTRLRAIAVALQDSPRGETRCNPRFRCAGVAHALESSADENLVLTWDIYNLSPEGAFLESKGPIGIDEELELLLEIGGRKARVRARVVRVQEPSWMDIGGVGVTFVDPDDEALEAIRAGIEGSTV